MENKEEKVTSTNSEKLKKLVDEEKNTKKKNKDNELEGSVAKKIKHGTMATALTCVFLAVLVLLNVVATVLFERYPINIDLTKEKIYSMTDESEEYVKKVDRDVLVTIFADEDTFINYSSYNKQAIELLKNYCKMNHHISYRFMDIDSNPDVIKSYSDTISNFDIIFETSSEVDGETVKRTRKLGMIDLLSFKDEFVSQLSQSGYSIDMLREQAGSDLQLLAYYGTYVESSNAEQAFTSALMTVTDPDPVYVTFLNGRNEVSDIMSKTSPFSYFKTLLVANGYNVNEIDITKDEIPSETDIAVIPAPTVDYLPEEVQKVSDFLNNGNELGKQLIYVASYSQDKTPNLDEFLEEYGLSVGEGVVCETYGDNYINYPYCTLSTDLSSDFNQDVLNKDLVISSMYTRPVNTLYDQQGMITTQQYVKTTDNAYTAKLKYNEQYQLVPSDTLTTGQQCLFAIGSKAKFAEDGSGDTAYSNVLCFGSEYLLQSNILSAQQYGNSEYFFSIIAGITHKSDGVFIKPKTIKGTAFDIDQSKKTALMWTFCVIIPVAVLGAGLFVWLRRKNK
ncbi:ABC transporter [Ruminococcus albus SY3]|uniref:ABC transporter n=1 Tax=Ruminococcus albus SY3 TaxID=1341156 RepID=A0A011UE70_RUMAL|nr:GldG family protein [Ruminococcus albus]EXM38919.1 ABC transporter [Ruminococcus albus SY3]